MASRFALPWWMAQFLRLVWFVGFITCLGVAVRAILQHTAASQNSLDAAAVSGASADGFTPSAATADIGAVNVNTVPRKQLGVFIAWAASLSAAFVLLVIVTEWMAVPMTFSFPRKRIIGPSMPEFA